MVAREPVCLEQQDSQTELSRSDGRCRSGRSATNDDKIPVVGGCSASQGHDATCPNQIMPGLFLRAHAPPCRDDVMIVERFVARKEECGEV